MISIIQLILLVVAGLSMAIMWTLQFHYSVSIFSKFPKMNPETSWKNKYKNGDPKQGAKFFLSTTLFAWTTDAFHFFQMIMLNAIFISMALTTHISGYVFWDFVILRVVMGFTFQFAFSAFYKKNK